MADQIVWLSTREAAERLGKTSQYVRQLIKAGKLPATRAGEKTWRIREDHLDAYQQETRRA